MWQSYIDFLVFQFFLFLIIYHILRPSLVFVINFVELFLLFLWNLDHLIYQLLNFWHKLYKLNQLFFFFLYSIYSFNFSAVPMISLFFYSLFIIEIFSSSLIFSFILLPNNLSWSCSYFLAFSLNYLYYSNSATISYCFLSSDFYFLFYSLSNFSFSLLWSRSILMASSFIFAIKSLSTVY